LGRIIAFRALLFLVPFVAWFVWAWWARRSGREMGVTPWPWLFAGAALLVAGSLMATAIFHTDNRGETYVPAEPRPDGTVAEGRFERR
jgi:hypothetical protein